MLLIEDDPDDVKYYLERCISKNDYDVYQYSSVGEVCEINISDPDIILTDLNVLDSHGINTFDHLQTRFPTIPIIILTGDANLKDSELAVKKGAYNYIEKSRINTNSLNMELKFALERSKLEKKLKESKELAERNSEFKSNFLAHFSHEIRTPLNAVIGMASLLSDTPLDPYQRELLDGLLVGSNRLISIINDILDITKIESGKMRLEESRFNIRNLIKECLCIFIASAEKNNVFLSDYVGQSVPTYITADAHRVKQILINYISNAIKYAPNGSLHVEVKNIDHKLYISVTDTGKGLTKEQQNLLFLPFTQANPKHITKGTGLGLSICKKLAQLMKGNVGVKSSLGDGSTFWFTFKVKHPLTEFTPRFNLEGIKILTISNDEILLNILKKQLSTRNIQTSKKNFEQVNRDDLLNYDLTIFDLRSSHVHQEYFELIKDYKQYHLTLCITEGKNSIDQKTALLKSPLCHADTLKMVSTSFGEKLDSSIQLQRSSDTSMEIPKYRVLIVDDDQLNRKILNRMLKKYGLTIDSACNGVEATSLVENKTTFDIIFMDCSMPIMDGYSASKIIKKLSPSTFIVALTAHAFYEDRQKCLEAGMDLYLPKPITQEVIYQTLHNFTIQSQKKKLFIPSFFPKNNVNLQRLD